MATSIDQSTFVKTALRLPPELHSMVHAAAQESGRSYNAELVERVLRTFRDEADSERRRIMESSLMGVQTMLAFHLREFFDLLPPDVQVRPINMAIRELAVAIGHGAADSIEKTLKTYFKVNEESEWFRQVAETIHSRRQLMDQEVGATAEKDPEPIERTIEELKASPPKKVLRRTKPKA